ncbi:hypothetical protein BDW22DRAFT_1425221 [Trametopsis cervina]|nr:hypothetical protein BDW22DRAFT_1425221 [Trametopsis cervina]
MELPTSREIELETLLRQRDAQVAELTDEVAHLRQYLPTQATPSVAEPISLPPPLVSLLLPHISNRSSTATSSSNTVAAALTQRVKVLQEENDELYELLKSGETGRLKEDIRSLRRVSQKLEGALKEAHQVIESLSEELDKSQATILASGRANPHDDFRAHSHSPTLRTNHQLPVQHHSPTNGNGGGKPPPTAPRAHKKPRLSEAPSSTPAPQHSKGGRSQSNATRRRDTPDHSPSVPPERRGKMDIDEDDRARTPPPPPERKRDFDRDREKERNVDRDREHARPRDRERDRHRERDRDRDRARDPDRSSKRNGAYGGSGGTGGSGPGGGGGGGGGNRRPRRGSNANSYSSADRTLAERMGL